MADHVSIYVGGRPGEDIAVVAQRAAALGHPYFVFNGYLVPSVDVTDHYQRCPNIGFHYLTDLERWRETNDIPNAQEMWRRTNQKIAPGETIETP